MELITFPAAVPALTLAAPDLGLGPWEMIVILITALLFFGANRFPDTARGMPESVRNLKAGSRPQPRRQDDDSRSYRVLALALIAVVVINSVLSLYGFSGGQKLALTVVLLGWIGVGYWAFRRDE